MTRTVAKPRAAAKSAENQIRNQKDRNRNRKCAVVLKLREILHAEVRGKKAAYALVPLLNYRSLSSCQKILDGKLSLNAPSLILLLQSEIGDQIYAALMDAAEHPAWYAERREDLNVFDLSKEVAAQQRRVDEALKRRIGR